MYFWVNLYTKQTMRDQSDCMDSQAKKALCSRRVSHSFGLTKRHFLWFWHRRVLLPTLFIWHSNAHIIALVFYLYDWKINYFFKESLCAPNFISSVFSYRNAGGETHIRWFNHWGKMVYVSMWLMQEKKYILIIRDDVLCMTSLRACQADIKTILGNFHSRPKKCFLKTHAKTKWSGASWGVTCQKQLRTFCGGRMRRCLSCTCCTSSRKCEQAQRRVFSS